MGSPPYRWLPMQTRDHAAIDGPSREATWACLVRRPCQTIHCTPRIDVHLSAGVSHGSSRRIVSSNLFGLLVRLSWLLSWSTRSHPPALEEFLAGCLTLFVRRCIHIATAATIDPESLPPSIPWGSKTIAPAGCQSERFHARLGAYGCTQYPV